MIIHSNLKKYEVVMEKDFKFIDDLKKIQNKIFVVDRKVYSLYRETLFSDLKNDEIYLLDALEEKKTIDTALNICERFIQMNAKKNAVIISIGGGIVQDITGFVANILYRGIKWIFVPTTLLACCDSCIGSKTSLNYKNYKNILGTFYPPDEIYICPKFLKTLSDLDFNSGLGEVIKFNVMSGINEIEDIENNIENLKLRNPDILNKFINKSLEFKKIFIEKDEFDKADRIYLNFAHTFGHAIEVTSKYKMPHGIAVVLGMLVANRISVERGILSLDLSDRIARICKSVLKIKIEDNWFIVEQIIDAIRKDKKQTSDSLTAILLDNNFKLRVCNNISKAELQSSFKYINNFIL